MTRLRRAVLLVTVTGVLVGCSKAPTQTAQSTDTGPDNAVTRYGQNLASSEQHAAEVAAHANAAVAQQDNQIDQATQAGNN